MQTITLHQPRRLVFGRGSIADCISYLRELGPAHLRILTSPFLTEAAGRIKRELAIDGIGVSIDMSIVGEPTVQDCHAAVSAAEAMGSTCILGLGGGSVLDVSKLVAAFVRGEQQLEETFGISTAFARMPPGVYANNIWDR